MARAVDLAGQTFGTLTVVKRAGARSSGKAWWLCRCACGVEREALSEYRRDGRTGSCRTACLLAPGRRPWPRHPRFMVGSDGSIVGPAGRLLAPFVDQHGYLRFNVAGPHGGTSQHSVHVVVCEAFHGLRPDGMHAAHLNGAKLDCRASNLQWKTPTSNEADKVEHGTRAWGESHGMVKLTEAQVREIRASGESASALARRLPVGVSQVRNIRRGTSWAHV